MLVEVQFSHLIALQVYICCFEKKNSFIAKCAFDNNIINNNKQIKKLGAVRRQLVRDVPQKGSILGAIYDPVFSRYVIGLSGQE